MEKNDPSFPKRVAITPNLTGWRSDELHAYIKSRPRVHDHVGIDTGRYDDDPNPYHGDFSED